MGIISRFRNDRQRSAPSFPRFFGDWQSVSTMTVSLFGKTTVQEETIASKKNKAQSSPAIEWEGEAPAEPLSRYTRRLRQLQRPENTEKKVWNTNQH